MQHFTKSRLRPGLSSGSCHALQGKEMPKKKEKVLPGLTVQDLRQPGKSVGRRAGKGVKPTPVPSKQRGLDKSVTFLVRNSFLKYK